MFNECILERDDYESGEFCEALKTVRADEQVRRIRKIMLFDGLNILHIIMKGNLLERKMFNEISGELERTGFVSRPMLENSLNHKRCMGILNMSEICLDENVDKNSLCSALVEVYSKMGNFPSMLESIMKQNKVCEEISNKTPDFSEILIDGVSLFIEKEINMKLFVREILTWQMLIIRNPVDVRRPEAKRLRISLCRMGMAVVRTTDVCDSSICLDNELLGVLALYAWDKENWSRILEGVFEMGDDHFYV
jgi:hypothetical protein